MTSPGTATSFSALTLLVESFDLQKPIPDMTYNVLSGTLSPAQSVDQCQSSGSGESLSIHPLLAKRQNYGPLWANTKYNVVHKTGSTQHT